MYFPRLKYVYETSGNIGYSFIVKELITEDYVSFTMTLHEKKK